MRPKLNAIQIPYHHGITFLFRFSDFIQVTHLCPLWSWELWSWSWVHSSSPWWSHDSSIQKKQCVRPSLFSYIAFVKPDLSSLEMRCVYLPCLWPCSWPCSCAEIKNGTVGEWRLQVNEWIITSLKLLQIIVVPWEWPPLSHPSFPSVIFQNDFFR